MYILSELADKDIKKLLKQSVINLGMTQTKIYFNSLQNYLSLLDDNPAMGNNADDIKPGYHRFTHQSHIIFYRDCKNGILIVRVLHTAMDVEKHFN